MSTCVSISNKMCVVVINHDEQEDILCNINHITELHIMYFRYKAELLLAVITYINFIIITLHFRQGDWSIIIIIQKLAKYYQEPIESKE